MGHDGHGAGGGHAGHSTSHGHPLDHGLAGFLRYARHLPRRWRNDASTYAVTVLDPGSGDRVVDIGAGVGPATVAAAARGASVWAVDPMGYMRRTLAVRRLFQRARKRIEILDGTAEHLAIDDDAATGVLAVNTVHHWQDLAAAAAEIERVLAPGGRVVLVEEDFDHPDHEVNRKAEPKHRPGHGHGMEPVTVESMSAALSAAGLVDIEGALVHVTTSRPAKQVMAVKSATLPR